MRLLFSWIAMKEDLVKNKKTGKLSGPTLQIMTSEKFDVLHLFSSDREGQAKASRLKTHVENNSKEFHDVKICLQFLALKSPAAYKILWEKLPKEIEQIISSRGGHSGKKRY